MDQRVLSDVQRAGTRASPGAASASAPLPLPLALQRQRGEGAAPPRARGESADRAVLSGEGMSAKSSWD